MTVGGDERSGPVHTARVGLVVVGLAILFGAPLIASSGAVQGFGAASTDAPAPRTLVETAADRESELSIAGRRIETVRRDGRVDQITVTLRETPPNRSAVVVRDVSRGLSTNRSGQVNVGDRTVLNGSQRWKYDASENRVVYSEANGYWLTDTQSFGLNLETMRDSYEFTYAGTERVAGRRTHVVEMAPPPDVLLELRVDVQVGSDRQSLPIQRATDEQLVVATETWWIDTATRYPVKKRIEWANETGAVVMSTTRTYETLTVGVDHEPGTFQFEPPGDAEVVRHDPPSVQVFDDRKRAAAAVPFALPVVKPAVPDGYEFQSVLVSDRENDSDQALMQFRDGNRSLTVGTTAGAVPKADGVKQNVGAVNGTLVTTDDGNTLLLWDCPDRHHWITGTMDADDLATVAGRIGCRSPGTTHGRPSLKPVFQPSKRVPVQE
jgi:outer membrane lipoprotein-sorting protein